MDFPYTPPTEPIKDVLRYISIRLNSPPNIGLIANMGYILADAFEIINEKHIPQFICEAKLMHDYVYEITTYLAKSTIRRLVIVSSGTFISNGGWSILAHPLMIQHLATNLTITRVQVSCTRANPGTIKKAIDAMEHNYHIIYTIISGDTEQTNRIEAINERNRIGFERCIKATITILSIRTKNISKDTAHLIARLVYNTLGTQPWC
jgi:hypothetical protein